MTETFDIAIIGGGISGFSSAMRLQKSGYKTLVLEAHGQIGGCAGFYSRKGFTFDVGATTLVDFGANGVGGNFLSEMGVSIPKHSLLDYKFWLPDKVVTLYNDRDKWNAERLSKFGDSENHKKFWKLVDKITDVFWNATRKGIKLPIQSLKDVSQNINSLGVSNLHLLRYLNTSILDILKKYKLENDKSLVYFISALIEDTIHSNVTDAPFVNAALGTSIRGAGVMRLEGGMKSLWVNLEKKYASIGGVLKKGNKVSDIEFKDNLWLLETNKASYVAKQLISSLLINNTIELTPEFVNNKIDKYHSSNDLEQGSAVVLFLGVPDCEVENEKISHHQIIEDYDKPLGMGNNMFISMSDKGDLLSAPEGCRTVMISTHCDLKSWKNLSIEEYQIKKESIAKVLIKNARRVYPKLAENSLVFEIGTPKSYQKYTHRKDGAIGGFKQTVKNANLNSIPQNIGLKNFYLVGDNTWPGLGTVAGIVSSKILFNEIEKA